LSDGNGNIVGTIDAGNGQRTAEYEYGPFGEPLRATGPMANANPFRFSTHYTDHETGLAYAKRRYYSPSNGRWLSRDPVAEFGGVNLFAYVGNNPIGRNDPFGLAPSGAVLEEVGAALAAAVGLLYFDDIVLALYGRQQFIRETGMQLQQRGPFAGLLWQHAVDNATGNPNAFGPLVAISKGNQGQWANAIDQIQGNAVYKERTDFIKQRLKAGTAATGFVNITFETPEELRASIHGAQLHYVYNPDTCILKFRIRDEYNFDKKHVWRELQQDGDIIRFEVLITMPPEKFDHRK
jgi:RHS repeat-associated protein